MRKTTLCLFAALLAVSATGAGAYVLIGDKWLDPGTPVPYRFNSALDEACITGDDEDQEIRDAFAVWANEPTVDITFVETAPTAGSCGLQNDGANTMSMEDCLNQCTGSCIAVTSVVTWGGGGDATWADNCVGGATQLGSRQESDITWSKTWRFGTFPDISAGCQTDACGSGSAFDIRGIAVHEIGHFIGLGHSAVGQATMFASAGFCTTALTSLHSDDVDGATCLYDPNYIVYDVRDVTGGNTRCSLNNAGNVGITGTGGAVPGQYGASFQFPLGTENLYEASLIMGVNGTGIVSSDYRVSGSAFPDNDFQQTAAMTFDSPSPVSDERTQATFTDARGESGGQGLAVSATMHAFTSAPNDDFIIVCYKITNTTGSTINDFRAGLIMDWDFANLFNNQSVVWDAGNQIGIITDPTTTNVGGVMVLNAEGAATFRGLTSASLYSEADKSNYLFSDFTATDQINQDINCLIATGDFSIAPGASVFASFALLGGSSNADLLVNAAAAQAIYDQTGMCDDIITDVALESVAPGVRLRQNAPNPFNPTTRIAFETERAGMVSLQIFDTQGRVVRTLIEALRPAGAYDLVWDGRDDGGRDLPSGIYFYTLVADGQKVSRKMTLLK